MTAPADLVTVLVPAKNEERSVAACLGSILSQDHEALDVIVLDAGSGDATADIVRQIERRDPRVRLVQHDLDRIPRALNLGLARAHGRWLVRVDAHSRIAPGYMRRVVDHLCDGGWGGVGGRKDGVASTPAGRAIAHALGSRFGVGDSVYHYGTGAGIVDHIPFGAYPTALVRALGGWDETLRANEDFELDYRIRSHGYQLLFDPSIRIAWESRESIPELFRQYRRYGRGKADVACLHPRSLEPRHLAAPGLVLALVGSSLIAHRRPKVAAVAAAPYALALLCASAMVGVRAREVRAALWIPLAFLGMHVGWGVGFWEELIARAGVALWSGASRAGLQGAGRRERASRAIG
jgi:succinoglycan biosynthesis protein ExoA